MANKKFRGVHLRVVSHEKPSLGEPVERHAREFEKLTGARITVEYHPFANLYEHVMWGLKKKTVDIVFCGRAWLGDLAPYLAPVPDAMLNSYVFRDVLSPFAELAKWKDQYLMVPIDGDRHFMVYRSDLISKPPATWKEYEEEARRVHGKRTSSGKVIYGSAEITAKDDLVYSQFVKRASAYSRHPKVRGGFYFDSETMKPLINQPGFVRALEDLIRMQPYFPPRGGHFSLVDAIVAFGNGEAALTDNWGDAFFFALRRDGPARDVILPAPSPGAGSVWNRRTRGWEKMKQINRVPYIPSSWSSGVAASSKHKEAAFDFLGFFTNKANHAADILKGTSGINVLRKTALSRGGLAGQGRDRKIIAAYLDMVKNYEENTYRTYALNIPHTRDYMQALNIGITQALRKRISPADSLDWVAKRWDEITDKAGRSAQRRAYLNTVALEDEQPAHRLPRVHKSNLKN